MGVLYTTAAVAYLALVIWYWTVGPGRGERRKTLPRTHWDRFMGQERSEWVPKRGWWRASDGKLYPPELHPKYRLPPPPPPRS